MRNNQSYYKYCAFAELWFFSHFLLLYTSTLLQLSDNFSKFADLDRVLVVSGGYRQRENAPSEPRKHF